jgi:HK97 family phage major capsid protein
MKCLVDEMKVMKERADEEDRELSEQEQATWKKIEEDVGVTQGLIDMERKIIAQSDRMVADFNGQKVETEEFGVDNAPKASNAKPFADLGDFLVAVARDGTPVQDGGGRDPRLAQLGYGVGAATGMSEGIMADGGALVQTDFVDQLLLGVEAEALVWPKAFNIPISSDASGVKIKAIDETSRAAGSRAGGVRGYWMEEAGTVTASKPTFRTIRLELKKLGAICYATDELVKDASAIGAVISKAFAEEFAFLLDDAAIRGTGSGMPLGIIGADATIEVAAETNQKAATVIYENIINMWARCAARSQQKAVWYINQALLPQLMKMYIKTGTSGVPVFLPPGGVTGSPYGTLLNRPVIPIEQCEAPGTAGDIILADMGQYFTCSKGGLQAASSMHVMFLYDEMTYRWTMRVDGQPSLASALTPYKGTDTTSPFVTLAARA